MNFPLLQHLKNAVTVPRVLAVALAVCTGTLFATATFVPADQPVGWVAQGEISDYDLTSGGETIYQTEYEKQTWSGNLYAYPVNAAGVVNKPAERWTGGAADNIAAQNYDTGRMIFTLKTDGTKIPFRWASLSSTQQTAIGNSNFGPKILDFVRGDRSNEGANGAKYRIRTTVLGDIVHSRPYYVPGTSNSTVYVGANDGMLHAINAANGNERYAYIPSMLIPQLANLTSSPYTHTWFVDATPNSAVATISGASKRILVGGLGAGGKGLYALDISADSAGDPVNETSAAAKILWEITPSTINNATSTTYAKLGYTYGVPIISGVNSSAQSAVIMGNGYLNSGGGTAVLYVIDAGTGALMRAIDTGSGSATSPNGLSSPSAIDTNGDGKVDYVYAGDIDGNLWKFDLTSNSAASWSATKLFTTSPAQAITGAPSVAAHPGGGYMINFGTGRTFTAADLADNAVFYAYGIRDGAPGGATTLLTQTLTAATYTYGGSSLRVRTATSTAPDWTTHKGWKVALPAGERIVGDGTFTANGRFYFNSYNPTVNTTTEPYGENWLHELDYLTGGSRATPFLDLNGDLLVSDVDRLKNAGGTTITGSAGVSVAKLVGAGVSSQPLLVQLTALNTTLFNSNPDIAAVSNPPAPTESGVIGGHFDADIYYPTCKVKSGVTTCSGFKSQVHHHQYDDIFDVTGLNMLNASDADLNLSNAIASTATPFKILLMNQFLSPAVSVNVGGAGYVKVKSYGQLATQTNAAALLSSLPTFTRANVTTLVLNMPPDAFTPKNWWGTGGDVRSGLLPSSTGCVHGMSDNNLDPTPGRQGERHNGALTVQLIKDSTPSTSLELNVAGKPEYGWRVKTADFLTYVLAEYTVFWHSSVGCYTTSNSSWTPTPPAETGTRKPDTPAAGSDDPKQGGFFPTSAIANVSVTVNGNVTTTVTTYVDGTHTTATKTMNANGTVTTSTVNPDGSTTVVTTANPASTIRSGGDEKRLQAQTGRISWHELLAQ